MIHLSKLSYFRRPNVRKYSKITQDKIRNMIMNYCKNIDVKFVFATFKVGRILRKKDIIPEHLVSFIYEFKCAGCSAGHTGETYRHLQRRIHEHLKSDRKSHIYKHLITSEKCENLPNVKIFFKILNFASLRYELKLKEGYTISTSTNLN